MAALTLSSLRTQSNSKNSSFPPLSLRQNVLVHQQFGLASQPKRVSCFLSTPRPKNVLKRQPRTEAMAIATGRPAASSNGGDGVSTLDRITAGLHKHMKEESVSRVVDSLVATNEGRELLVEHEGMGTQQANSYLMGLKAENWHNPAEYSWAQKLEQSWETVRDEFLQGLQTSKVGVGGDKWNKAVRGDALAYGPEWRTLVLQDRGRWSDDDTTKVFFPKTTKLMKNLQVPSSEVFFARQGPNTGIKPHTDFSNFTLTGHLALQVPEGDCWIKVGNEKRNWEEGKTIIMDTSFIHETYNNTSKPRYVLIFRFWHPEVTEDEKNALLYVFDCLDMMEYGKEGFKEAQKNLQKRLKKSSKTNARKAGRGFG